MLEQEMASIIRFVLDNAGKPSPYYWNVPQHFMTPAAFFPTPEISTGGETFLTYSVDYVWHIRLTHRTGQGAYSLAYPVLVALRAARNLVPLIAEDGSVVEGSFLRIDDPKLRVLENGDAQLTISWRSRKPYSDTLEQAQRTQTVNVDVFMKSGKTISDAYADALEAYSVALD